MTDDLSLLDATAQAELVRRGDASPAELVDAAVARIEALNPQLNAVIHERFEAARSDAAGDLPDGPFRGVPTLFKDLMCAIEGEPYHEGLRPLKEAGYRAPATDNLARRLLASGLVCLGRTNTPEIGLVPTTEPPAYGPTRNPWDTSRTTGGSSGGSAAAVASGMVPVAHGNDGGGSIRIPASCCGLVGLKPSRGRSSLGPRVGQISSPLPVENLLARSVRDVATALDVISAPFPGDPVIAPALPRPARDEVGADPGRLRIGLLTANPLDTGPVHADCVAAAEDAARALEALGHAVEPAFPAALANPELVMQFGVAWFAGAAAGLDAFGAAIGRSITADDVEPLTWAMAEAGRAVTAEQYLAAVASMERFGRDVAAWWDGGFDLLLTPTLAEPPVPLGTFASPPDEPLAGFLRAGAFTPFTPPFNATGQPAVSLPWRENADGLPIGVHLVAAYGREDVLVRVASQVEAAHPWASRRPPVHAAG
ncbi:MAG: amidase [Acidimicrobiia bacterium]|nr:amidase [Acidimicrobiia bacterium]